MSSPVTPAEFAATVPSPSASLCTRFFNLLQLSTLVSDFMDWMLTDDGEISTEFLAALNSPPVGTIVDFAGPSAPTGWLICDGTAVSRTTYANLFNIIGTTYGAGDNSTTFNLPDARGRCSIGAGTGTGLSGRGLAQTVGTETHTLTEAEIPEHTHPLNTLYKVQPDPDSTVYPDDGRVSEGDSNGALGAGMNINTGATGDGDPHNNMQPSIVFNKIIRY